ncbi:MAG: hypothetical protein JNK58_00255 [Phycisphaerae bacterium]|nr:hypothetical protein [Phycisphaerae bacterium]
MPKYDEHIIEQYADRLYRRARGVILNWAVALGVFFGGLAYFLARAADVESLSFVGAVGAAIGLVVGFLIGTERAFAIRLKAQQTLCQLQIEKNTRTRSVQPTA